MDVDALVRNWKRNLLWTNDWRCAFETGDLPGGVTPFDVSNPFPRGGKLAADKFANLILIRASSSYVILQFTAT